MRQTRIGTVRACPGQRGLAALAGLCAVLAAGAGLPPQGALGPGLRAGGAAWPMRRGDAQNSGRGAGAGAVGKLKWQHQAPATITTALTVAPDGVVYAGCSDGSLYALDSETGEPKWKFETWGPVVSTPAIGANGDVYLGSAQGILFCVDGRTGEKKWEFRTSQVATSREQCGPRPFGSRDLGFAGLASPIVVGAEGVVYLAGNDARLYAVGSRTGARKWQVECSLRNAPAVSPSGGRLYASGSGAATGDTSRGAVFALAADTGRILSWTARRQDNAQFQGVPVVGPSGRIYVAAACIDSAVPIGLRNRLYGVLLAFDRISATERWQFRSPGFVSAPAVGTDGSIVCSARMATPENPRASAVLYALEPENGAVRWKLEPGESWLTEATVGADGTLYVGAGPNASVGPDLVPHWGAGRDRLLAVDGRTGRVKWSFPVDASINEPPALGLDGTVYVGCADGKVYAVR